MNPDEISQSRYFLKQHLYLKQNLSQANLGDFCPVVIYSNWGTVKYEFAFYGMILH